MKYPLEKLDELANSIQALLAEYHKRSYSDFYSSTSDPEKEFRESVQKSMESSSDLMGRAGTTVLSKLQSVLAEIEAIVEMDDRSIAKRVNPILDRAKTFATHPTNPLGYGEIASTLMQLSGHLKVRQVYRPKIFVGHSFKEEDEAVVKKFLQLFNHEGFDCETGEKPEAQDVDEKVKRRIGENEGLIIIGTRDQELKAGGGWTIPPWLRDENAYAMGKGKPTLLFFEDSIDERQRKGIQGDYEHIIFARDDVSDAIIRAIPYLQDFKQKIQDTRPST